MRLFKLFWILPFLFSFVMLHQKKKIKIFLAGDSTMSVKRLGAYPETGWGMPFVHFWDSTVTVVNLAQNGRSTQTFITEGWWKKIMDDAQPGDYVFIQFGHNDESVEKKDRYTTPEKYMSNLEKFIKETRDKKAIPVLITPVSRRKFTNGEAQATHATYTPLVLKVAVLQKVPVINLDEKSRQLYQSFGEETSKLLFLQLKPGEHPNYPEGKNDNTHFNELGARLIAQLVLADIKTLLPALADRIVKLK